MTPRDYLTTRLALAEGATIAGFTGYKVDTSGRVWSTTGWRGSGRREMTPCPGPGGYLRVHLVAPDGRRVNRMVHRLVAQAFLGPQPEGTQTRHLNGNKVDNRAANLAWGTAKENAADRERHGTTARGTSNGQARLTSADVVEIRRLALGASSQRAIAARVGVDQKTVQRILSGEGWTHVRAITDAIGADK
jgi:HNH endonuclease